MTSSRFEGRIAELLSSLEHQVEALEVAATAVDAEVRQLGLHHEDIVLVGEQVKKTGSTTQELRAAAVNDDLDGALLLLHRLNNQLTGALSIAILAREDFGAGHALERVLQDLERAARNTAASARALGEALKSLVR